eukprot:s1350_g7.t2
MVGDWFLPPEHQGPTVLGSSFGSRTGEDSVGLEGAKQSGSHSGGTGVDNRQGALEEPVLVLAFAREVPYIVSAVLAQTQLRALVCETPDWAAVYTGSAAAPPPRSHDPWPFKGWQRFASRACAFETHLTNLTPASRALLLSQAGPVAARAVNVLPTRDEISIPSAQWRQIGVALVASELWLGCWKPLALAGTVPAECRKELLLPVEMLYCLNIRMASDLQSNDRRNTFFAFMDTARQDVTRAASSFSIPSEPLSDASPEASSTVVSPCLDVKDAFSRWVEHETVRCAGSLPGRLVNLQLLSWLTAVQVLKHRQPQSNRRLTRRAARHLQRLPPDVVAMPPLCRDLIRAFVGDQGGVGVTASGLRLRVNHVRVQDISQGLFHEFQKAADKGLTSYYLNQNIKLIPFWRPWMLEPDGPTWIRNCLESRGFKTDICKVYHTAYAGVQGCSFFELKALPLGDVQLWQLTAGTLVKACEAAGVLVSIRCLLSSVEALPDRCEIAQLPWVRCEAELK